LAHHTKFKNKGKLKYKEEEARREKREEKLRVT
jgi:hypothetical protein